RRLVSGRRRPADGASLARGADRSRHRRLHRRDEASVRWDGFPGQTIVARWSRHPTRHHRLVCRRKRPHPPRRGIQSDQAIDLALGPRRRIRRHVWLVPVAGWIEHIGAGGTTRPAVRFSAMWIIFGAIIAAVFVLIL